MCIAAGSISFGDILLLHMHGIMHVEIGKLKLSLVKDGSLNRIAGVSNGGRPGLCPIPRPEVARDRLVCARHTVIYFCFGLFSFLIFVTDKPLWHIFHEFVLKVQINVKWSGASIFGRIYHPAVYLAFLQPVRVGWLLKNMGLGLASLSEIKCSDCFVGGNTADCSHFLNN